MNPADDVSPRSLAVEPPALLPVVLAVVVGFALSAIIFFVIRQNEAQRARAEFDRRVDQQAGLLREKIEMYEEMFLALRNFQIYAEPVNREEFRGMAGDYLARHSEIRMLQWVPHVPAAQRAAVEAEVRTDGFPNFEFAELGTDGGRVRAPARPDYLPLIYVEPMKGHEAELGFDLASDPLRRKLLDQARDTGEIGASGRIKLAAKSEPDDDMLVVMPVYHLTPVQPTVELRRQKLAGFVIGIFRIHPLLENSFALAPIGGLDMLLLDRSASATDQVMHYHSTRSSPPPEAGVFRDGLHREIPAAVGGRDWLFLFRPAPEWLAAQGTWNPYGALISGVSFTLLLAAYLLAAARRSGVVAALVQQRTAELRETNVRLEEESRQRQKATRASGKSAVLLRATLESTGDGILVVGAGGKIESYNSQFRHMWGLSVDILTAGDDERALHQVQRLLKTPDVFLAKVRELYTQAATASFDVLELKDGRIFERYSQPQVIDGHASGRVWSFRDVTERQRGAETLAQERTLLRTLIDSMPDNVYVKDVSSRNLLLNEAHRQFLGARSHAEAIGKTVAEFVPADIAASYLADDQAVIQTGRPVLDREEPFTSADGSTGWFLTTKLPLRDAQGGVIGLVGISRDITERKRMEAEQQSMNRKLLETQKLESLGVLAGGIAHDFNNLLTGILGNASLARMDLPEHSPVDSFLEQIETASLRAADLCKQMLAYSGKGSFQVQRLNLNTLVEETTQLLQVSLSKKAALHLHPAPDLPPVTADAAQLQQVVMNLVINASEAIGDQNGDIHVRTGVLRVDRDYLLDTHLAPDLPEGEYVSLEVSDTGCGMDAEIQARIFDPFFTTKFTGRGLGLAAVLGIVRGHRGALKVYSEPGRGTTFKLLLPRADGPAEQRPKPAAAPVWHGTGTVLVVDDEAVVREVAALVLEEVGFQVVLACDGADGVAKFRERPGQFVAVLMDLTMPHLDGVEAFREIRKIRADTRVLLMSGFNEQDAISRFTGKGLAGFIQKPFRIESLREKMRSILE